MEHYKGLKPGEFVSEGIVDFYLTYIQNTWASEKREQTFIFSSTQSKMLYLGRTYSDGASLGDTNIFTKKFVVFPVYHAAHFYLVIIAYLTNLDLFEGGNGEREQ